MTKQDMKCLLLGQAILYMEGKGFKYWELVGKIESIIENNTQYEGYDMDSMKKDLWDYLQEIKEMNK